MIDPTQVRPHSLRNHVVALNDGGFSITYGVDNYGLRRFAMRWNGNERAPGFSGYPNQGAHPLWFQLPDNTTWTEYILNLSNHLT